VTILQKEIAKEIAAIQKQKGAFSIEYKTVLNYIIVLTDLADGFNMTWTDHKLFISSDQ